MVAVPAEQDPSRCLLFVDDDEAQRILFTRTVNKAGYRVDCAGGAEEALEMARANDYPVVVTDLRLPRRDGVSLIRELREFSPESRFIISTGAANLDLASDVTLDPAITSIVSKPWEREELVAAVSRAFSIAMAGDGFSLDPANGGFLVLEDNDWDAELLRSYLSSGHSKALPVTRVKRLDAALDRLARDEFSVIIADLSLPDARGFDSVTRLQRARPDLPVIVLTGIDDENLARHSVQFGAQDYLVKGTIDRETLMRSIRHATERKQVEQRLSYLSRHDELTGLANRTSLRERVANAIHRSRRRKEGFGIFLIDMDHFKAVNDRLGHAIGDEVLRVVGSRIQDVVREVDVAARLGGDEFAVLADAPVDPLGAAALAARLRARLREPIRVGGEEVTLTASLGAALYPHDGETLEELVNSADSNMYVAKRDGRDRFVLGEVSDAGNPSLRRAIADQEFVLHYQPQIQLSTHRTVGLEALLRWERSGTLVPPSSFIPLLEEEGLMREVSSWILNAACAHISQVRAHEGPMRVAVNASPCQLRSPDFASEVDAALLRCALPGAALELEVTEAVLTHESPATLQTLNELREIGVRIAIDDFGTGSLTLAGLNQFPVQALKIDRSFVQCLDVPASPDAKLVNAVVSLAQSLDLEVIAEGVETEAQLSQLRRMGCDMAQGFLLGRPSETGLPNGQ